jgi:mRNA interferase HigB
VRIFSRGTLIEFWSKPGRSDAKGPLEAWHTEVAKARWESMADIKKSYRTADYVGNDRVVFNIGGNKYRLIVAIRFQFGSVYIRFVGTHAEYDAVDASKV